MCNFDGIFGHWRRERNRKNAAAERQRQMDLEEQKLNLMENNGEVVETADRVTESSSDKKKKNTISSLRLPTVNTGSTNTTGLNIG